LPESNYKALYVNGKTLRRAIDPSLPITELRYPEFYDVKITDRCDGRCSYCYQDSSIGSSHFKNVPEKIRSFFGKMDGNQRPFQVAIGGGEPTLHPEFYEICKTFKEIGIDPNYTTNGLHLHERRVLEATDKFVNGVAVSCHEHLDWRSGVRTLVERGTFTNLHVLISDERSVRTFEDLYLEWVGCVKYFVLLPMISQGRCKVEFTAWDKLRESLHLLKDPSDVAFGAMLHPYLDGDTVKELGISVYEPESMSKYLVMDDEMKIHPSSFSRGEAA
jgi:hypothetical protein